MLNVAVIMGRLVANPELKHTPSDIPVASFTLAVERSYAKPGTERQADFIDVVAWRGLAEFVCKYFRKGQMMAVHGSIQTRTYTDANGNKRKAFEIVAADINFADSKKDGETTKPAPQHYEAASYTSAAPFPDPEDDDNPVFGNDEYDPTTMSDDDLPFN